MKMIDFEKLYSSITTQFAGNQKRIDINGALTVYYGLSPEGYYRLAFRSSTKPPKMDSTKLLHVTQGKEGDNIYWTCFDLLSKDAKSAFYAFCQNLVEAITETTEEYPALDKLKKRYISWKALFKKTPSPTLSREIVQGLFGELYFLNNYMIDRYSAQEAVMSWGGPDSTSKDFAIGTDWFEIKTIGVSTPCVRISSLAQLSSASDGQLVVIHTEHMPDEYSNGQSCISELVSIILGKLEDETLEGILINKISSYGVGVTDESFAMKFDVKDLNRYHVSSDFPRITTDAIPFPEINNVSYEISVASINRFLED